MEQAVNHKAMKFREIAEDRVNSVLKAIRAIGKLTRKASYEHTPDQIDKMFAAMRRELDEVEQKFAPADEQVEATPFSLD